MRCKILEQTLGSTFLIVVSMRPPIFLSFPFFKFIEGNSGLNGSPRFLDLPILYRIPLGSPMDPPLDPPNSKGL